jgi:hypothetical protein
MRHFATALTLIFALGAAAPVFADTPLLTVTWDDPLAEPWAPPQPEPAPQADPFDTLRKVSKKVESCQAFKVRWSESSARKLYRALNYHGANLQKVDLQPWVDVQVTSRRDLQPFSVHPQNSGRSVGVVPLDPAWNLTYVVAQTSDGPIVASQTWPSPAELDAGATCRPVSSRIEYPDERRIDVAIEPFRMWGMRVADSLPADKLDASSYEALVTVIRTTDGATASMY